MASVISLGAGIFLWLVLQATPFVLNDGHHGYFFRLYVVRPQSDSYVCHSQQRERTVHYRPKAGALSLFEYLKPALTAKLRLVIGKTLRVTKLLLVEFGPDHQPDRRLFGPEVRRD
jgi:hypothetical protein